ncbi:MAG: branched-chain amino acid ABC transporter permease [Rhizobiaceae bacterium]|nr:branched-chain amino acid ABC transporter permease [Rhizobiaceae bacterium]
MILELLIRGILLGMTYGLLAFPVSLLFVTTGSVDVAIGAYVVIAAAVMFTIGGPLGVICAIGAGVLAAAAVGLLSLRLNRPGHVDHVVPVLATFGVATFFESLILTVFGTSSMFSPPILPSAEIFGIRLNLQLFLNAFICVLILIALMLVLQRSPYGRAMRASAVNPTGASLNGIPVRQVWFSTYVLGGLLASITGILILYVTGVDYSLGFTFTIWGFGSALIFGMRSPLRGFAGGTVIGIIQALSAGYLNAGWATAMPLLCILVVLSLERMNRVASTGGRV